MRKDFQVSLFFLMVVGLLRSPPILIFVVEVVAFSVDFTLKRRFVCGGRLGSFHSLGAGVCHLQQLLVLFLCGGGCEGVCASFSHPRLIPDIFINTYFCKLFWAIHPRRLKVGCFLINSLVILFREC